MKRVVLIDALAARYGGTAYAAIQLVRHLAVDTDVSVVLVVTRRGSIVDRGLVDVRDVRCITLPAGAGLELGRRLAWEAFQLPRVVARERVDLVISMSGMLPRPLRCEVICLLFNPVMYERVTALNLVRRWAVRRTARRASSVFAPSRWLATLASESIGTECIVLPLGVDRRTFHPAPEPGDEVLCVADFYAHKRHELLLDAWLLLPSPRPRLHLIGQPSVDRHTYNRLTRRIDALSDRGLVEVEQDVNLRRLVAAYHHARVVVVTSERESFCLPLAESMACAVPPVVRDVPSLRETGGAGATYVQGDDPRRWAGAIRTLLENDREHARARQSALAGAARFSWDAFARELVVNR